MKGITLQQLPTSTKKSDGIRIQDTIKEINVSLLSKT